MDLYEAKDYRGYINAALDSKTFGRGARAKLADFLGVRNSFISTVLGGAQDFTLEHAFRIAEFLSLNENDRDYLLLLIQKSRAGSQELKNHFQKQLDRRVAHRNEIKNRVARDKKNLTEPDLLMYYGAWYHTAIHMMIRNPEIKEPKTIAQLLGIDLRIVSSSLEMLEKLGFIEKTKSGWKQLQQSFHLGKRSPAQRQQHTNWRMEAIRALPNARDKDIHYTAVMSIDSKAAEEIRGIVLKALGNCDAPIRDAKDEEVHAFTIDLFRLV